MVFKIECIDGQFSVNGKPVSRRGFGWRHDVIKDRWYYEHEAYIDDRLADAVERGLLTADAVAGCNDSDAAKQRLWDSVKGQRPERARYADTVDKVAKCEEAVASGEKVQPVNKDGAWYGTTICFTGQMFDKDGNKMTRALAREAANQAGFVWLENVIAGCALLVTGEPDRLTRKTKKALEYSCSIVSPDEFWQMV